MKHLGDVTQINGAEIAPVDIITFGSPCQDMSVAGKRSGMKHEEQGDEETTRSGLFYEAIRIIKEMRKATNGEYPKYAVWENVPGAFSSNKGWDFHAVLEAFCSVKDNAVSIPKPYDAKRTKLVWDKAGEIVGDNYSVAWRTLDAQYWGVPQRRKRIYLVADFTSGCAKEILFKPDSLRRNLSKGIEAGQGITFDVMGSTNGSFGAAGFKYGNSAQSRSIGYEDECSPTLSGASGGNEIPTVVFSFDSLSSNSMKSPNPISGCRAVDIAKCIDTTYPDPSKNQGGIAIVQDGSEIAKTLAARYDSSPCVDKGQNVIALQANGIGRAETAGCDGCGWRENESYTLNTIDRHAVCFENHQHGGYRESCGTLRASGGDCGGGSENIVCYTADCRNGALNRELSGTLQTKSNGGFSYNCTNPVCYDALVKEMPCTASGKQYFGTLQASCAEKQWLGNQEALSGDYHIVEKAKPPRKYIIRRLTPTECARLQGFPDRWGCLAPYNPTDANFWEDVRRTHARINGKKYKPTKNLKKWYEGLHTDSTEYRLWGNGIALPNAEYVIHNIAEQGAKTLGSLFDGSGGFPLAGVLNGIEPYWASEVEPYGIAVTVSRFGRNT